MLGGRLRGRDSEGEETETKMLKFTMIVFLVSNFSMASICNLSLPLSLFPSLSLSLSQHLLLRLPSFLDTIHM